VGLYLLVDAHLRLEDGNVLRSFRGLRLRR
jgi:hypothetical protein